MLRRPRSPYGVSISEYAVSALRTEWLNFVIRVEGYIEEIVHNFEDRLETIFGRQEIFVSHAWRRLFEIRAPLVCEFILEVFSTCRISSEMGLDVADALCFQLGGARRIQYLFMHAKGRKSCARLSGGHFIGYLAHHCGLVSDDGLRGLSIMTCELPLIDMGELVKLNICMEVGDDWAWVVQGVERQPVAAAAALRGARVGLCPSGLERLKEVDYKGFTLGCCGLIEASRRTYQAFDGSFRGNYPVVFERCTRQRTNGANTSTAQQDEQPDP
ncbi:hypothetical protein Tco_0669723 [Tanacetum coccineum]